MPDVPNSKVQYQNGPLTPNPNGPAKKTGARSSKQLSQNTYDATKQLNATNEHNDVKV